MFLSGHAALARKPDDRLAGDAVEEAVGDRRVNLTVFHEENIGSGAFSDAPFPIQHHGVGVAFALGLVLRDRADHVQTGRLGRAGRRLRIRTAILGEVQPDSL